MDAEDISNLNDSIDMGLRKDALSSGTLNVKRENAQRRYSCMYTIRCKANDLVKCSIYFNLT